MKVTKELPTTEANITTAVTEDSLMNDPFVAWAGGVLGLTSAGLIIFVVILICIAILLSCVACICICRCCFGKQKKHKAAYQKMPSLYVDQLPGHDGGSGGLGSLEYSLEYNMKSNTLKVGVIQVQDLFLSAAADQMDPYVKVTLETDDPVDKPKPKRKEKPLVYKTETKPNCVSACFNENFSFNVPYDQLKMTRVKMIVYDHDPISKDSVVGGLTIGLEALPMENYVGKTYEAMGYLSPSEGADDEPGQLCVVLTHMSQEDELHVNVLEARQLDLPLHHGKRYPDTAVSVTLHIGTKKLANKKTDYKGNTNNPYYGQTLVFPVKREKLMAADLTLSIKYKSHGGALKTFGKVYLGTNINEASNQKQWHEMLQNPRRPVAMWHSIIMKGATS